MEFNLPPKVRLALYVLTVLGSPVVGYLVSKGILGTLEQNLWLAEVTVVAGLAAFNVSKK